MDSTLLNALGTVISGAWECMRAARFPGTNVCLADWLLFTVIAVFAWNIFRTVVLPFAISGHATSGFKAGPEIADKVKGQFVDPDSYSGTLVADGSPDYMYNR